MNKWFYAVIALLIIGIVSGFFLWKIMVSPQYSLQQLDKAITEHDVMTFNKYVSLDEVIDNIIVQTWQYYTPKQENPGSQWSEFRQEIGNSLLFVVKPNLKEIIKKEVLDYVTTGRWTNAETEDENKISSLIIRMIKEKIDPGQWDHQSINYAKIEEQTANIGLTYYDQANETNFLLEVRMRDMKGYWQIIEITNVTQLLNTFQNIDSI